MTGAAGIVAALIASAPAIADPGMPDPQPAVAPAPPAPTTPAVPAPQAVVVPESGAVPPAPAPPDAPPSPDAVPAPDGSAQATTNGLPTPPDGMPHLSSPQNLPPDTTDVPPDAADSGGLGYLRDIWHAYQTQDVSGRDALLLLAQRPMSAGAAPPPGIPASPTPPQPAGPQPPGPPGPPDAPPPAP
jgi:hypothetical protein